MSLQLTEEDRQKLLEEKRRQHGRAKTFVDGCDKVRSRFKRGETIKSIADEYDVTTGTIAYHLRNDCECETRAEPLDLDGQKKICPVEGCEVSFEHFHHLTSHINCAHNA